MFSSKRNLARIALLLCLVAVGTMVVGCASAPAILQLLVQLTPNSAQTLDQGKAILISAVVMNSTTQQGVSWTLSGAGTLSAQTPTSVMYQAPPAVGTASSVMVTATSLADSTKTASLTINLMPPPSVTSTSNSFPKGTVGVAFPATLLTVSGGIAPFTWTVTIGSLPAGLNLAGDGTISGNPTTPGTVNFTVQVKDSAGLTGTASLAITVNPAALQTISVTPNPATVAVGSTVPFTATGHYSDNSTQNLTTQATWTSASPLLASIVSTTGVATGVAAGGPFLITAMFNGISGTANLTVTAVAPTLQSISVTPNPATAAVGSTVPFTATGHYSDNSTQNLTTQATWTSASPLLASIVSTTGVATGVAAGGPFLITAMFNGISGTSNLTVTAVAPTLQSISVTPNPATVAVGSTVPFTAIGHYSDNSTQNLKTQATWTSASPLLATIVSTTGVATGVAAGGPFLITAMFNGISGTANLTVTAGGAMVHNTVVDQDNVPLNNVQVVFSTSSGPVSTDPDGNFQIQASPGSNLLTITNVGVTLLSRNVTVNADGTIVEYPNAIQVTVALGGSNESKTPFVDARPPLNLTPTMPFGGQSITVAFSDPNAQSVSVQFTGAGCGNLINGSLAGSSYTQTAQVANAGSCQIAATVQYVGGPQVFQTQFLVRPTHITLPALSIIGGDFIPGDSLPAAVNLTGTLSVTGSTGPGNLINGALERIFVQTTDSAANAGIVSVQVGVHGSPGYFTAPAKLSGGQLYFDIALDLDYFTAPTAGINVSNAASKLTKRGRYGANAAVTPTQLMLDIQMVDSQGNISDPNTSTFPLRQVGNTGGLQISVSWGSPDDLDLHVVEPSGNEIYYGSPISPDGGQLDLDSNPGCTIDNIDNENVTWPNVNKRPPGGQYIVRVDYYESCSGLAPLYQVTVNNCGNVSQFTGGFAPNGDDGGGAGAGVTVSTFQFTPCGNAEVSGVATYEDLAPTPTGLATTPTDMPIRYADVQVRRASDDFILATSTTDGAGNYDVTFLNTGTPGYYVKVIASGSDHVNQDVQDAAGKDWFMKSLTFDETVTPNNTGINIRALTTDVAPAFNVFNIGVDGTAVVKQYFHAAPTHLTWIYFYGQDPPGCPGVSCFSSSNPTDTISVNGGPADPDVYDDLVLLHEFGHFVQKYFSADHSAGGYHQFLGQYSPTLAWSEGSATFFGLFTRQTSEYIDTTSTGIGQRFDATIPISPRVATLGTRGGTQKGFLSEVIPTAAMWAMAVTDGNPIGVFAGMGAVKGVLPTSSSARDFTGADLVDFLDGWFCTGSSLVVKLKVQINQRLLFPYDYAPLNVTNFCVTTFPDAIVGVRPAPDPPIANPGGTGNSAALKKKKKH
jgi:hypothetical protein